MLRTHQDLDGFAALVVPLLYEREPENSIFIGQFGLARAQSEGRAPYMSSFTANGRVEFAAFYRELNLILSHGSESALPPLVESLRGVGVRTPGVQGPKGFADRFAELWSKETRCSFHLMMDQLLYRLERVVAPARTDGQPHRAEVSDLEVAAQLYLGFCTEAVPEERVDLLQARSTMEKRIAAGNIYLWIDGGRAVAMTGLARPTANGITVNAVYTLPSQRGRGYASALAAEVSAEGLRRGKKFCVLYADLTNPTSNSIYRKIGYAPIAESRCFKFDYDPA